MKRLALILALTLVASTAQADLLSRWETAEEAITERQFALYNNSAAFQPWSAEVRAGKACLLAQMQGEFTARQLEGYVSDLEGVAAGRMSFTDPIELASAWSRAASANRMWFEVVAPLAASCNSSF